MAHIGKQFNSAVFIDLVNDNKTLLATTPGADAGGNVLLWLCMDCAELTIRAVISNNKCRL